MNNIDTVLSRFKDNLLYNVQLYILSNSKFAVAMRVSRLLCVRIKEESSANKVV